jgi:hypothetical protein
MTGKERRIKRWEHEAVIDAMQQRLDQAPDTMRIRRQTVEHSFDPIGVFILCVVAAVLVWLVGRACRYVLSGN